MVDGCVVPGCTWVYLGVPEKSLADLFNCSGRFASDNLVGISTYPTICNTRLAIRDVGGPRANRGVAEQLTSLPSHQTKDPEMLKTILWEFTNLFSLVYLPG